MSDEQKKQPKQYFFYCTICGTQFKPTRAHARTCSDECRITLSTITRYNNFAVPEEEKVPVDKEKMAESYKAATGKEMPKSQLDQYTAKAAPEAEPSLASKAFGKGKKEKEAVEPTPKPEPAVEKQKPNKKKKD
jgi:hypothetical protein